MPPAARSLVWPLAVACAGVCVLAVLGLTGFAWTDYDDEAARPVAALVGGDPVGFLQTAPAYGGSLLLRAPFAFLPSLWGGGELAVFRALALPCLAAGGVVGVVLASLRHRYLPGARWTLLAVALVAANPITLRALEIGHPEELLGACLCVLAVLAARAGRAPLATVLLGLALANKAWAVLAIAPVLVALPARRGPALVGAVAIGAALTAPFLLVGAPGHDAGAVGSTGTIFQPWQAWWFLGDLGSTVRGIDGLVKPDYRVPPDWLASVTRPLIAALWLPAALLWRRRRGPGPAGTDALLLLALLFLLRCLLDPWNTGYYHLPFLLALAAWEALGRRGPPVLSLSATVLVWTTFEVLPGHLGPDAQSLVYLAWALPLTAALTALAWRPGRVRVVPTVRVRHVTRGVRPG